MGNYRFFRTIDDLKGNTGISSEDYKFAYADGGVQSELQPDHQGDSFKLKDVNNLCDVESRGLSFSIKVTVEHPEVLMGRSGIVCEDAELGLCIIWTCKALTHKGYVFPDNDRNLSEAGEFIFNYAFKAGTIKDDLELKLVIYVKKSADYVPEDEACLINETGVIVGEIKSVYVSLKDGYMDLPVRYVDSSDDPLWWVKFTDWYEDVKDNPKENVMFCDSFTLYLNKHYRDSYYCKGKGKIKSDVMADILAQTYLMMFQRLDEKDLEDTKNGNSLEPDTVCSILYHFIDDCERNDQYDNLFNLLNPPWEQCENLLKSLQTNFYKMLEQGQE